MPRHKAVHRQYKAVVSGFKVYWDDPLSVRSAISQFEGKAIRVIFFEDQEDVTKDQWAFYYGVVLKECLNLNEFGGYTKKEVHQVLFKELRGYKKGKIEFVEDFDSYGKKDMAKYIEELIPKLALDYNLFIDDPSNYYF
jgi:hypothetical protein